MSDGSATATSLLHELEARGAILNGHFRLSSGRHSNVFVQKFRILEDPVTGSLNASLAQWLIGSGIAPEAYVAAQGARLARAGRVHIACEGDTVWVGGSCVSCVRGELSL